MISVSAPNLDSTTPDALKREALQALADLPPFSAILTRLIASLSGESVSLSTLGDLIEKDTVIAGNVLYLVNSALYARRGTVNSVRHALSLLGVGKVRNAVLGMSILRMWRRAVMPTSWSMARLNMHWSATAILSDLLAQRLPVKYPEGAFVAGLLHDLGRMLIALGLPNQHEHILALHGRGGHQLDCERRVLGWTHPELSADALAAWNLPAPIRNAVRFHHAEETGSSTDIPLSQIVKAANEYVNSIGVSILASEACDPNDAGSIASLGLEQERLIPVLDAFKKEHEAMAAVFQ